MSMFAGALLGAGAKHQELQMEDIDESDNQGKSWKDRLLLRTSRRQRQKRQSGKAYFSDARNNLVDVTFSILHDGGKSSQSSKTTDHGKPVGCS